MDAASTLNGSSNQGEHTLVRDIADSAVSLVSDLYPDKGTVVSISIPPGTIVAADPAAFHLVFVSLLSNAVRYSLPGERVVVSGRTDGPLVTVSITNVAPPLTDKQREEIFKPFIRLDDHAGANTTPGRGFGAHLVRRFVELYSGTISVASSGKTVTSTLQLPGAAPPARVVDLREEQTVD